MIKKKELALKKKGVRLRSKKNKPSPIVIDAEAGLVFGSEQELYEHFQAQIRYLESEYDSFKISGDIEEEGGRDLAKELDLTLDQPSEIWHDAITFKEFPIFHFIRPLDDMEAFHVAITYVSSEDEPTFIFLHFITRHLDLINKYRRGDLVYDRAFEEVGFAMLEGDSLTEADPMAMGLFLAMLKLRGEKDVAFEKFQELGAALREETIENADEIWSNNDLHGNVLVSFIKAFPDHEIKDLHYVAVTQEDPNSNVHSLLFSFPTNDETLVDRYRHGENLQAEEVAQESSH